MVSDTAFVLRARLEARRCLTPLLLSTSKAKAVSDTVETSNRAGAPSAVSDSRVRLAVHPEFTSRHH